ncbi:MAG: YggT family protein, partial [Rhodocyclaceae bacterium]|nr:YggT family protein [Rhodocyclaceae bacterium]
NALSRPFLRPFQRLIPPIANIDLSPLVLLLVLQIALMLLTWLRAIIVPLIA